MSKSQWIVNQWLDCVVTTRAFMSYVPHQQQINPQHTYIGKLEFRVNLYRTVNSHRGLQACQNVHGGVRILAFYWMLTEDFFDVIINVKKGYLQPQTLVYCSFE